MKAKSISQRFTDFHEENPRFYKQFAVNAKAVQDVVRGKAKVRPIVVFCKTVWDFVVVDDNSDLLGSASILFANHYAILLSQNDQKFRGFFDLKLSFD